MKFYDRVLRDLRDGAHTFETIHRLSFGFGSEVFFEDSADMQIFSVTYDECARAIRRACASLRGRFCDLPEGSVVALRLPNSPEWVTLFWALLMAGFRPLLLSPDAPEDAVRHMVSEAGAREIVGAGGVPAEEILAADLPEVPARWADEVLLATSGTTGEPKVCAYDGRAMAAQILNARAILDKNPDIRRFHKGKLKLLAFLPFCHVFGLTACLMWFSAFGRTFVFLRDYSPETILNTCRLHEVTHVFAVPLLWDALAAGVHREARKTGRSEKLERASRLSLFMQSIHPRLGLWLAARMFKGVRARLLGGGIRFAISGGGALRSDTARTLSALGYPLYNGYGMTEIGIASVALDRRPGRRNTAAVGKPLPSVEFQLDAGGGLSVRGESCMAAVYKSGGRVPVEPGAWIGTGDVFRIGARGEYEILGRADDLINTSAGERISPDAVEAQLFIEQATGVCALDGPDGELTLVLEVPLEAGAYRRALALESAERCFSRLPFCMRPKRILFCGEALPRTAGGKVMRAAIRNMLRAGALQCDEARDIPGDIGQAYRDGFLETLEAVRACFCEVLGVPAASVDADSNFLWDLSGDSLRYFALLSEIEKRFALKDVAKETNGLLTPRSFAEYILKA
ncbi:MAG: AMP-binding protein [Clostridiales bacterium]|nr:AMP-binding protein [Clostridiales bacterium]